MELTMQERIERVSMWVGFTPNKDVGGWNSPREEGDIGRDYYRKLPNFTEDLNAEFRWLVPEVLRKGYSVDLSVTSNGTLAAVYSPGYYCSRNDNPALALFEAVEQMIDQEEN